MDDPAFTFVDSEQGLRDVVQALKTADWCALDTESNSMFVYKERICLIQINAAGKLFLIDTLALPYHADTYALLKPILEDPGKVTLLHGGEYDVTCLKRDFGIAVAGVFDSQQAASYLGWEKTGYGSIVEKICAVTLTKAFTQYDWATRPLDPGAVRYAVDDVVYLPQVCEHLRAAVAEADLTEEIAIANEAVMSSFWSGGFDPEDMWRIKGMRDVPLKSLPTLAALYVWRNGIAEKDNRPPGRMLNNEVLLALARNAPTNYQGLKRLGLKSWFLSAHGDALMTVIKNAQSQPPRLPNRPKQRDVTEDERLRETRLKDWRRAEAETRKVPLQVVLPAKALEYLKQHGAFNLDQVPQLGAKRIARYGGKIQDLCV
jgi:ribonuclease D